MNTYTKEIIDCIDELFPKGDPRRGDALVLQSVAYLEGKEFSKGLICPTSKLKEKMDEKIKDKVREIQDKYCGEPVETKLYYAIEKIVFDIKLARQCVDFQNIKCDSKDCQNEYCPLNKIHDPQNKSIKKLTKSKKGWGKPYGY